MWKKVTVFCVYEECLQNDEQFTCLSNIENDTCLLELISIDLNINNFELVAIV